MECGFSPKATKKIKVFPRSNNINLRVRSYLELVTEPAHSTSTECSDWDYSKCFFEERAMSQETT